MVYQEVAQTDQSEPDKTDTLRGEGSEGPDERGSPMQPSSASFLQQQPHNN